MDTDQALVLIEEMKQYAISAGISLILVGSVGYRSALIHHEEFAKCDDIDCVFIYRNLDELINCPYIKESYWTSVEELVKNHLADMFSTKLVIRGIRVSADFISEQYLNELANEKIDGESKYRIKATDAIENEANTYCNFWGEKLTYQKSWITMNNLRLYRLPIHLYSMGLFYPGVLLNKFLYNPVELNIKENDHILIRQIQKMMQQECIALRAQGEQAVSVLNTAYKKEVFSPETKKILSR